VNAVNVVNASVYCLSVHAAWRCRHSGACCSSGWAIPVEAPLHRRLRTANVGAFAAGIESREDLPPPLTGILRTRDDGSCVFFDRTSRLCDIHRQKGHDWLPASCQQFPRVSLLDPRGTFVTLSHYCPSAVELLFADGDAPIEVVVNPTAFPGDAEYDGLDARDAFPPFLRPGVLMDWETLAAWDRFTFDRLNRETRGVDAAMRDLRRACDHLRAWTPSDGPLVDRLDTLPDAEIAETKTETSPSLPASEEEEAFIRPLCRYAAAKFFGSWCWYQGAGLRTVIRSVEAALAEVRAEAARQSRQHGRMLDRSILRESIRQADLRLVHLASREALAREWSKAEDEDVIS
jgi:Fe-S-cluster containining protein